MPETDPKTETENSGAMDTHPRAMKALMDRVWAMHPAKLEQIGELTAALVEGRRPEALFPAPPKAGEGEPLYRVVDGVAVIRVADTIDRRMNLFMNFSGGTSTQVLEKAIRNAAEDPNAAGILLDVDSPGGSVFGLDEVSETLRAAREKKPVAAFTGGMMCSAAYWIASAATTVVATQNAEVGSIGVACLHVDRSERHRMQGVKPTWITAGRYKRMANQDEPLSREGQDYLQSQVDDYYALFVEEVARNRGVSVDAVLERMAGGRTYTGKQALKAGLVDVIGNIQTALALARGERSKRMDEKGKVQAPPAGAEGKVLTVDTLKSEHPDVFRAVLEQGKAAGVDEGRVAGAEAERARVAGILELDGDPKETLACIQDGASVDAAGTRFFQAEKSKRGQGLKELQEQAPPSVGTAEPVEPDLSGKTPEQRLEELVRAKMSGDKPMDRGQARLAVYAEHPELKKAVAASLGRAPVNA